MNEKLTKTGKKFQQTPVNFTNRFAPLGPEDKDSNQNASSSDNSNFTTVLVGDSIIKQRQGWKLGKKVGHRIVVKSFSGATTSDMKHYLKPTLAKNPLQILLHVGTNDLRDNLEWIAVKVIKPNAKPFIVGTWYRPPGCGIEILNAFVTLLHHMETHDLETNIICDFNYDISANPQNHQTKNFFEL